MNQTKKEEYVFSPIDEGNGIINYTGVEANRIYLANRNTILDQDLPSYLPPVEIRRTTNYDIPAFKIGDNEYFLKGASSDNKQMYRVSLDVYAALINYHLEYDRAAFAALAEYNNAARLEALANGKDSYHHIDERVLPSIPEKLNISEYTDKFRTRYDLRNEIKPSRVSLKRSKAGSMSVEPYYFIQHIDRKKTKREIFALHKMCLDDVKQKITDMEAQKNDYESSWTKGRETSYGDSNLNSTLLDEFGVQVKRQNGSIITPHEIEEVRSTLSTVHSIFGDVSEAAREYNLKISHAGTTRMHASKFAGLFSSYHRAIGVSFPEVKGIEQYGFSESCLIASHEYAHFLDHVSGKLVNAWFASDIPGTTENKIAVSFRNHMIPVKGGDYWSRTCECFARAMEQYAHITLLKEHNPDLSLKDLYSIVSKPAFVSLDDYEKHIIPLADALLSDYRQRLFTNKVFQLNTISIQDMSEKKVEEIVQKNSTDNNTDKKLTAKYSQLEIFDSADNEQNTIKTFYQQLDDYLEKGIKPQGNQFYIPGNIGLTNCASIPEAPIRIRVSVLKKAQKKHNLTNDEIRRTLETISNPILIYDSNPETSIARRPSILIISDALHSETRPIAIALVSASQETDPDVHEIRSIHDRQLITQNNKNVLDEWMHKGLLRYVDTKKISEWQRRERVYFPMSFANSDIENLIHTKNIVNTCSGIPIRTNTDIYLHSPTQEFNLFSHEELESKPIEHRPVIHGEKLFIQDEEYTVHILKSGIVSLVNSESVSVYGIHTGLSDLPSPAQLIKQYEQSHSKPSIFEDIQEGVSMEPSITTKLPFEEMTFAAQKTTGIPTTVEHTVRAILDFSIGSAAQFTHTDQVEEIQKFQLETAQWAYEHDRIGSPFDLYAEYAEVLQAKQAEIDAPQDVFYQDGIKVYKTRTREENGDLKEWWAVQDERNIGTDRKAYDLLFDSVEQAKEGAIREKKGRERKTEQKILEEKDEKNRIEQEEKRKEMNRGLSITERKANVYLEKNLPRAVYHGKTAEQHMELEGTYLEKVETDHSSSYNRQKYNRMDYQEQQEYEKKLREPKTEYRMYTATPGQFFEIGATLYNYLSEKYPNKIGQKEETHIDMEIHNQEIQKSTEYLQKQIYSLAVEKNNAEKELDTLREKIKKESDRLTEHERSRLSSEIHQVEREMLRSGAHPNSEIMKTLEREKEKLTIDYSTVYMRRAEYTSDKLVDLERQTEELKSKIEGIDNQGRLTTRALESLEENLTETIQGSYNNIEENNPETEEQYDNNRPTSQIDRESAEEASIRPIPESEELRRDDLLQTTGYAGIRTGSDFLQSAGREDIPGAGYTAFDGELPESVGLDDRDGSGGIRTGSLPETERNGDRGQSEVNVGTSRNGYVSPKTARDIRAECISILNSKSDHEITDADRAILAQYEGAGGLGEKTASAAGVLSEFYTPENVISSVWKLVDAYHPNAQTVMEPSAGTGRFAQGRNEQFTLHELDDTSSRIARLLHPEATVITGAFQKQFFDPSGRVLKKGYTPPTYDVVVGNPPYGTYTGKWKGLGEGKHHARYEEYFIEKGLDSLNPDGVLAFVVPSGFLRSGRDSVKEIIASKGTLLDAWRLPNGAFPTTEVGTDIIVMKRGISDPDLISNDRFFIDHPEHIVGEETVRQGRFGQEQYVAIPDGQDLQTLLEKINPIVNYSKQVNNSVEQRHLERESIVNPTRSNENTVPLNKDYNLNTVSTEESIQSEGQSRQDTNSQRTSAEEMKYNNRLLSSSEFAKVYGKEHDEREQPIWAATSWNGFIDLNKLTVDDRLFLESQSKYIEVSPGRWMHKILFASGNIYEKLAALEAVYSSGMITQEIFSKQTEILEEALPKRISLSDIHFSPMTTLAQEFMVPISGGRELPLREGFVNWVTGYAEENKENYFGRRNFDPALSPISKEDLPANIGWSDIIEYLDGEPVRARRGWSEEHKKAQQIEAEKKRVARRETADTLFDRYIHEGLDEYSAKRLETEWNRRFNNMVNPDYSKLPLYVDGMSVYKGSEPFTLYEQQIKGISFLSNKGNGLLAYDVGVGKTAAGIVATVNQIQTGRATRPLIIVPKSVYSKWTRDIQQLFPNIPVNDLGNFSDKHLAKYRTDESGLSIPEKSISVCTIEALQRISFTDSSISGHLFEDFSNLLGGIDDDGSDRKKKLQEEMIIESVGHASQTKEGFVFWEHTGFDHVTVDEAHRFKNLYKTPRSTEKGKANEYAGLGAGNPSARALKLFGITQLVQRNNDNRNVFLLTATPFTNSPLEVYSMLSYMGRERLKEMHLYNLKSFMDEFAEMKNEWAVDAKGTIQSRQVMKNFRSLPALQNLLLEYIDKVDGEEAGVIRPLKFTHIEKLEPTALQKQIIEAETDRMLDKEAAKKGGVLVAMNNMRMAMLSPALLQDVGYEFEIPPLSEMVDSSPKLKMVCDTIVDCWNKEPTGGQILYMPRGVEESKYVKEYLVQKGIPENVIGFINSSVTDAKKDSLTEAFNDKTNALKIIIGSETISEGVDLNGNSYVCYNTMLGWNPTETIQVEGRAWRQGNEQGHVHMVYPLMEDSIDALLYQKYDEKSSRINALWSYKGDRLNVEDINPEELKFDLIKDPSKKADFILSEKTADLQTEQVLINGRLETINTILDKKITFETQLKEHQEKVSEWIERKKEDRGSPIFYNQMIERENEKAAAAQRNLPVIQKKLEGMGLETQDKIDAYIRSLNERKKEIQEEIKNILESKDEIITNLRIEEEKKKAVLPTFEESQQALVEKVVGNLRPMSEVEAEIRKERGEQQQKRSILAELNELEGAQQDVRTTESIPTQGKSLEIDLDLDNDATSDTKERGVLQSQVPEIQSQYTEPLVVDRRSGQLGFFEFDNVAEKISPESYQSTVREDSILEKAIQRDHLMLDVEREILESMSDPENEQLKNHRDSFYQTIKVDPDEKLLYPDLSLSDISIPINHEGVTYVVRADIILHSAFVSDSESSTGINPEAISGIDEYLNPANFSLSYFGMPKMLDEVTRLREQYIRENLVRVEGITEPEILSMRSSLNEANQNKVEYKVGNIYAGNDEKLGKWRGIYAGEGQFELTRATETGLFKEGDVVMIESNEKVEFVGRKVGYKPPQVSKEQDIHEVTEIQQITEQHQETRKEAPELVLEGLEKNSAGLNVVKMNDFYSAIGINVHEPLFKDGKSFADLEYQVVDTQSPTNIEHSVKVMDILYRGFISETDVPDGAKLDSIHGMEDFLDSSYFGDVGAIIDKNTGKLLLHTDKKIDGREIKISLDEPLRIARQAYMGKTQQTTEQHQETRKEAPELVLEGLEESKPVSSIHEKKLNFYQTIGIDVNKPVFKDGRSLADLEILVAAEPYWNDEGLYEAHPFDTEKVMDALYNGFISEEEHEDGAKLDSIHGMEDFLNSKFFDSYENTQDALQKARENYVGRTVQNEIQQTTEHQQETRKEAPEIVLEGSDGSRGSDGNKKIATASSVTTQGTEKKVETRKPYFQLNAEKLLDSVKAHSAPFLGTPSETGIVFITPKAIRSADNGHLFRGTNQILAQIAMSEMECKDTDILTYDQAKRHGAGIMKGSPNFNLTTYDTEKKVHGVYKYYPVSAVYNREKLPALEKPAPHQGMKIVCEETSPEKYLGKYLAATALNARFETTKEIQDAFKQNLTADLEKAFSEKNHTRVFELGNKASSICRETLSDIFSKLRTQERIQNKQQESMKNNGLEPHNPVTGEKFVGETAKKALYLMDRRQSKDPRFLEVSDILAVGLSLKKDATEQLVISSDGKSRFFYNAIDIEGIPAQSRQTPPRFRPPSSFGRKENSVEMEM